MTTTSDIEVPAESVSRSPRPVSIRLLRLALWLLVITGPATAGWVAVRVAAMSGDLAAVTDQVAATAPTASTAQAEGFAELAVAEFLRRVDTGTARAGSPDGGLVHTVSVGADEVAPGYFAVTVAADQPPSAVSFYTVGIATTEAGWVAVSGPSLVAAPPAVPAPDMAASPGRGIEDAGLEQALDGFVAALLAGDGDIGRYVTPGSSVTAVSPAPFTSVKVVAAGAVAWTDGTRLVAAEVQGTTDADGTQSLTYSVVFSDQAGRWEVVELLAAPPLQANDKKEGNELG